MSNEAYWDCSSREDGDLGWEVVDISVSTRVCKSGFDELGEVGGGFETRHLAEANVIFQTVKPERLRVVIINE